MIWIICKARAGEFVKRRWCTTESGRYLKGRCTPIYYGGILDYLLKEKKHAINVISRFLRLAMIVLLDDELNVTVWIGKFAF